MPDLGRVTEEELEEAIEKGWMVYVLFTSDNCPVCKDIIHAFNGLKEKMNGAFCEIDARANIDLCSQYSVDAVPTVVVIRNERVVGHMVGQAISIEKILSFDA